MRLELLLEHGLSPAEAIDYYFTTQHGYSQTAWASKRGVDQSTVSQNVRQAKHKLQLNPETNDPHK